MMRPAGEMPFLDHLEELRQRLFRSLGAVVVGFAAGLWLVDQFGLVSLLKAPIAPFLPDGKLVVLSPTEPLLITLKLGFLTGLVLASPVILWQLWAFLSPALYAREKKAIIPALFAGLGMFLLGGAAAFFVVVPKALGVLMGIQSEAFTSMITYEKYFSFVIQLVLAMGLSFEVPLLMILLAALGVTTPALYARYRRWAIVLSFVAGAVLSPGGDILTMAMLTVPLLLLYEVGVSGAHLAHRRRLRRAATAGAGVLLLLCGIPAGEARAQQPPRRDTLRDTTRLRETPRRLDTASARRLGLPSGPTQSFLPPDSIVSQLLALRGYVVTRYRADTATVQVITRVVDLRGNARTDRGGTTMEADAIRYRDGACALDARGDPRLFQEGQVLIGDEARYDTCEQRGVLMRALTSIQDAGANWFVRGNLAVDSSASRRWAASSEITSCDLPLPHYYFAAKEVKWVSQSAMVARPAVLYIRDVPVAWLPFIFQDTKSGRRSGILIPQFGFNDIVRPSRGYNRQVTNIGFYWAANDYFDATVQLDWLSHRYVQYGMRGQYRWLDRQLTGALQYQRQAESGGGSATWVQWGHSQQFSVATSLQLSLNYATNTSIVSRNAINPILSTQQITSQLNFTRRFPWGNVSIGGNRRQNISDGSGTMRLPSLDLTPKSLDFGPNVTWSPALSVTNDHTFKTGLPVLLVPGVGGLVDTLKPTGSTRATAVNLDTPLRLGSFNWRNSLRVQDADSTGRTQESFRAPDLSTPDPADSVDVTRIRGGGFGSSLDWDTGINLPILLRSTWKVTPTVGVANAVPGAFALRNTNTNGAWVTQGKRFSFGVSASPTFFAIFSGIGSIDRIRHSISPILSFSYSPAASIPEEYARAILRPGQTVVLQSDPTQAATILLSQNFEAKSRPEPGDTSGQSARKYRLLSIQTSGLSYDFEQAKKPGRTGWTTASISNTLASDLVPGFNLSLAHDLWRGAAGSDTSRFEPFLSSASANFSLSGSTLRGILGLVGLAGGKDARVARPDTGPAPAQPPLALGGDFRRGSLLTSNQPLTRGQQPFSATVNVSMSRTRPVRLADGSLQKQPSQSSIGLQTSFSPTQFWGVSWSTQYNAALSRFESHQIALSRDLHDWRASFNFLRNANGNFAFYFAVFLTDLPDIRFDYNQATIQP